MKKKFSRLFLVILICCCGGTSLVAQTRPHVYDFLRSDYTARSAAMAGAFATIGGDPAGFLYNPGLLATMDSTSAISFTGFKHLLDINSGSLIGATTLDGIGSVGGAITFNSYGSFERTDRSGNNLGNFGSGDLVVSLGWGNDLGEGFSAGVGGKAIYSAIDQYSSFALAIDGGVYFEDTASNIQAGLSLLHLGTQLSTFSETNEPLPLDLKLGISHRLRGLPLLLAVNFSQLLDETDSFLEHFSSFSIGGEFEISDPIRLRLGYDNRVRQDVTFGGSKGLGGISAGLGLVIKQYNFDYSFNSLAGLGGQHRITLSAGL